MRRILLMALIALSCFAARVAHGSAILWNTFEVLDLGQWENGLHLIQASSPYAPGIGILDNGDISTTGSFNADWGGSYWVYSFWGDTLSSFDDYLNRELAADVGYTSSGIIIAGANFNGHEDLDSTGHTYLAFAGFASSQIGVPATVETGIPYCGWVELDGMRIVWSGITSMGPLVVGAIPEPSSGLLLLLGVSMVALKRRILL